MVLGYRLLTLDQTGGFQTTDSLKEGRDRKPCSTSITIMYWTRTAQPATLKASLRFKGVVYVIPAIFYSFTFSSCKVLWNIPCILALFRSMYLEILIRDRMVRSQTGRQVHSHSIIHRAKGFPVAVGMVFGYSQATEIVQVQSIKLYCPGICNYRF